MLWTFSLRFSCLQLIQPSNLSQGLCIGVTVVEGTFDKMYGEAQAAKLSIQQTIKDEGVKGFADVVVSGDISEGVCHL